MLLLKLFSASILVLLVGSALASPTISVNNNVAVKAVFHGVFDYVVLIVMENQDINQTYKCGAVCNPYLTPFADNYSLLVNSRAVFNGSLPNYFALTMGRYNPGGLDCSPNPTSSLFCPQKYPNIAVDRIEPAGLSWKAYVEEYPGSGSGSLYSSGGCYLGDTAGSGNTAYAADHNPFVYFQDVVGSEARCNQIVRANTVSNDSGPEQDDVLLGDLNNAGLVAPNYMWLGPNECDQMHHPCSWPGASDMVTQGSMYLANMVPQILNSYLFRTQRAALLITFDECQNVITNNCLNTNRIYTVWASNSPAVVSQHYKSNLYYNHYSALHTLEWAWNLPTISNDTSAPIMKEFFT
jgi:Phosphoesterase family